MLRAALTTLLVLVSLAIPPFGTAQAQGPEIASRQKVYLLRGFTNVLSPGIDQLAEELQRRNIPTSIANHVFESSVASEALQDCRSGRVSSIVLVGHSFGATAALQIAETLRQSGVRVALIVTMDPVIRGTVPGNVHRLENYYLSSGVGTTMQRGDQSRGAISNVDLKANPGIGHVSLTTLPAIHKQVLRDIAGAHTRCE